MYGRTEAGVSEPPLIDADRRLVVASGGGDLAKAAFDGRLFSVQNAAVITTSGALNLTWTGLCVGNPTTSGKDYVFHEFGWAQQVAMNTEGDIGLMVAAVSSTMTQVITPRAGKWGLNTSNALCDDAVTIVAPIQIRVGAGSSMEGLIGTLPSLSPNIIDLEGSIVIPPGFSLLTYTFAIQTASIKFHFVWEEVDV